MPLPSGNPLTGWLMGMAARLRFPQLFGLLVSLFLLDLLIPDVIPFVDELLLGLLTLLVGSLRKDPAPDSPSERPVKNVTPPQ